MRVGELPRVTWGDIDEPRGRWRVSRPARRRRRAGGSLPRPRCSRPSCGLSRATTAPRSGRCSKGSAPTSSARADAACGAAGDSGVLAPRSPSPARLACSIWAGMPWARIGELVGHGDLDDREHLYPRRRRRGRARLRGGAPMSRESCRLSPAIGAWFAVGWAISCADARSKRRRADGATVAMRMPAKSPIFNYLRSRGARMACPFCGHEDWHGWTNGSRSTMRSGAGLSTGEVRRSRSPAGTAASSGSSPPTCSTTRATRPGTCVKTDRGLAACCPGAVSDARNMPICRRVRIPYGPFF